MRTIEAQRGSGLAATMSVASTAMAATALAAAGWAVYPVALADLLGLESAMLVSGLLSALAIVLAAGTIIVGRAIGGLIGAGVRPDWWEVPALAAGYLALAALAVALLAPIAFVVVDALIRNVPIFGGGGV
jgi:hypothetical protein